jgi:integrase
MSRSKPPTYRHHKPSGQAIVVIRGKTIYLGRWKSTESQDEYKRIIAEWATLGGSTPPPMRSKPPSDIAVSEVILAYWNHACTYYAKDGKRTSETGIIHQALKPLEELYGHTPVKEFGPLALETCLRAMVDRGWSRGYVNCQLSRVKRMFKWAVSRELIPVTIYQAILTVSGLRKGRTTARETSPVRPVIDEIVERTLAHLSPVVRAMVQIQRLTGMRPEEVTRMRALDIKDGCAPWEYRPGSHKTEHHGKEAVYFLGPRAQEILGPFLSTDLSGFVFSPKRAVEDWKAIRRAARKSKLWPSHLAHLARKRITKPERTPGDHYSTCSYRRAIQRGCDLAFPHPSLAGIAKAKLTPEQRKELDQWRKEHRWHPHQLRHSRATEIRRRFGLDAAQAVLNHSELSVTQVYAEKNQNLAREVMREIGCTVVDS